uniref:Zinc finger GATA like protein 1 n=1 Tax=Acanthochromis polyacanthus TaxID=80966 RepID=A0A3Q1EFV4_9TELE
MQATSFVQGNQSRVEHDAPHSALFYLFQEVSKLTSPVCPGSVSFLDTCPSSIQLNETSRKDPLVVKKRGEDTQSLPPVLLCDQLKKVKKEGPGSNVTTLNEPHCECKNPGKVLSLINLHCEKLLHQGDAEELESCSVSSAIRIHHSTIKSSTAERAVPEGEVKSDSVGAQCTLRDASLSPVEDTTEDEKHRALAELQSSSCNVSSATSKPELLAQEEEVGIPSSHQWRIKTPRKQPHPSRSADIQDPDFQGVIFRMDTELDDSREQCRLLITSKYSKKLCKSARKPRLKTRTSQNSFNANSMCFVSVSLESKVCASCCTRKTPMWRDAEDGTPLCNACGIRYKKYRVRCVNCWHIPRKEGNSSSSCLKCGNFVRLTSAQRKHTT